MNILVVGGAGYIGSVVAQELVDAGHEVFVFDNPYSICSGNPTSGGDVHSTPGNTASGERASGDLCRGNRQPLYDN